MAVDDEDLERINKRLRDIESNLQRVLTRLDMEWMEHQPADGVPADVVALANSGDKIGAVQRYRELTGSSLGEANEVVSAITP